VGKVEEPGKWGRGRRGITKGETVVTHRKEDEGGKKPKRKGPSTRRGVWQHAKGRGTK